MMKWYQLANNPQAAVQLYGDPPDLRGVELSDVSLGRDSPLLRLNGNMPTFPDNPPQRWLQSGYNTVHFELDFWEVYSVELAGWSVNNVVDIHVERDDAGRILLNVEGETCRIRMLCGSFYIQRLSGYIRLPE